MKKNSLLLSVALGALLLIQYPINSYAQCSDVAVKEEVENGSFEKGYLKNNGTTYTDGSTRMFKSGLAYAGDYSPSMQCIYALPDKWGIGKQEIIPCNYDSYNVPYGTGYITSNQWKDHTKGNKDGFAFIADLFTYCQNNAGSLYVGSKNVLWGQDVTLTKNQTYYYSSWFANYSSIPESSTLHLVVVPYDSITGDLLPNQRFVAATLTTQNKSMIWEQVVGTWNSGSYKKAMITIEVDGANSNCVSGSDYAIDDISFINSCQNVNGNTVSANLGDNQSICHSNGTLTLKSNVPATNAKTFTWYEGTSANQNVLIDASTTQDTLNISNSGTYRVCINDVNNISCPAVSATVIIDKSISASVNNVILCSTVSDKLKAIVLPVKTSGVYTFEWPGLSPSLLDTLPISESGTYSVNVSNPAIVGCTTSVSGIVTNNLPLSRSFRYCNNGSVPLGLTYNDGKKYNWYSNVGLDPLTNITGNGTSSATWTPASGTMGNQVIYVKSNDTTHLAGFLSIASPGNKYPIGGEGDTLHLVVKEKVIVTTFDVLPYAWSNNCYGVGSKNTATFVIKSGSKTIKTWTSSINCGAKTTVVVNYELVPGIYTLYAPQNVFLSGALSNTTSSQVDISSEYYSSQRTVFVNIKTALSNASCAPFPVNVEAKSVTVGISASNNTICIGDSVLLTASASGIAPFSYVWNTPSSTEDSKLVKPEIPTTYNVSVTDSMGCTDNKDQDIVILTTQQCLTNINETTYGTLSVYPNPTKGNIYLNTVVDGTMEIRDVKGEIVMSDVLKSNSIPIDNLNPGIYILKITVNNAVNVFKIIKN